MAQIKRQLRMGGREILTPGDFCRSFSPTDLLRNREMAAGFARRKLSSLSPWHNYHGEMLFQAVFCWGDLYDRGIKDAGEGWEDHCYASNFYEKSLRKDLKTGALETLEAHSLVTGPEFYRTVPGVWSNVKAGWLSSESSALKKVMAEACPGTLETLWTLAQNTDLPERDREKLFVILAAGYFLGGKSPEEYPITPAEARRAYLREAVQEAHLPVEREDSLIFAASDIPYALPLTDLTTTSSIHTITLKKLVAVPSAQGATQKPVLLRLGEETLEIMPGDYRYASFLRGKLIRVFPVAKEIGDLRMERRGNVILLTRNGVTLNTIDCAGREILDFGADKWGNYILLEPGNPDYSHFPGATGLPTANIVEVDIREDGVYLLNSRGRVTKNGQPIPTSYPITLENARTEGGTQDAE